MNLKAKNKSALTAVMLVSIAFIGLSCMSNNEISNADNISSNNKASKNIRADFAPVAVVELFTSQGCSSCPPADVLLKKTIESAGNKQIYALSFHVDYWNRLGWKDPFSNADFSARQYNYVRALGLNGAYTPQMVVNGEAEFVGSNAMALQHALQNAFSKAATTDFEKLSFNNADKIVSYELKGEVSGQVINVAVVSEKEITIIKRGENSGRTLENDHVVKAWTTQEASLKGQIAIDVVSKKNESIIVYIQDAKTMHINGAAKIQM